MKGPLSSIHCLAKVCPAIARCTWAGVAATVDHGLEDVLGIGSDKRKAIRPDIAPHSAIEFRPRSHVGQGRYGQLG
jgi:hypothetical protein